jgi:hypothetical protein
MSLHQVVQEAAQARLCAGPFRSFDINVRCATLVALGSVDCISVAGLELWFNSDDHLPPHFHAEKPGEWEVRVFFLQDREDMFEVKWTKKKDRPSMADLKMLAKHAERNRTALLTECQLKVNVTSPRPQGKR